MVKKCIAASIVRQLREHREQIALLKSRRGTEGWNFSSMVVVQEGLAFTLERVKQYERAVFVYEEAKVESGPLFILCLTLRRPSWDR